MPVKIELKIKNPASFQEAGRTKTFVKNLLLFQ
jgi:hypothetical protein